MFDKGFSNPEDSSSACLFPFVETSDFFRPGLTLEQK